MGGKEGSFEEEGKEGKKGGKEDLNISEILKEERISLGQLSRNGNYEMGMFGCKGSSEKYCGKSWKIFEKGESGNDQRDYLGKFYGFFNES